MKGIVIIIMILCELNIIRKAYCKELGYIDRGYEESVADIVNELSQFSS